MVPARRALIAWALLAGSALRASRQADPPPGSAGQAGPIQARAIHERIDLPSREACGTCHGREQAEWERSLHARAWTNANIRVATQDFRRVECRACHSPLPVLPEGLDQPPDYRDFNQEDGVHCLSCHGLGDGVAGVRDLPEAPCRPRAEPRLRTAELCWPCHEPTHQAFQEYRTSKAFAAGQRCQDCHMPPREAGGGHFHGDRGGFNPDWVREALSFEARRVEDEVVLTLQNRAGHKFPGEISSRSFLIRVFFGEEAPVEVLLRKPHKGEARADDRLLPDERRVLRFPFPSGVERARLELRFLPLPLLPPEQGFLLGQWSSDDRAEESGEDE